MVYASLTARCGFGILPVVACLEAFARWYGQSGHFLSAVDHARVAEAPKMLFWRFASTCFSSLLTGLLDAAVNKVKLLSVLFFQVQTYAKVRDRFDG